VDGSVEATKYACFYEGDPAKIKSMGDSRIVRGNVSNAQPDPPRLPPSIFTSVRLVRRVPVGVGIDQVRDVVRPVASITATVQVDPRPQQPAFDRVERAGGGRRVVAGRVVGRTPSWHMLGGGRTDRAEADCRLSVGLGLLEWSRTTAVAGPGAYVEAALACGRRGGRKIPKMHAIDNKALS
jgi:hypothetical protein